MLASGGAGQHLQRSARNAPLRVVAGRRTAARVLGLPLIDDRDPATGACEHQLDDVVVRTAARHLRHRTADGHHEGPPPSGAAAAGLALAPSLPGLVPQHRLRDERGRIVARFDLGDEVLRLAVEADGKAGHAGAEMAAKDRLRDRRAARYGWRTERVTWWELRRDREAFARRVLTAAAEQASRRP